MLAKERGCRLDRALTVGIWLSVALLLTTFYPGAMSIDSYTQLLQARNGYFGDWHPPFMAWLWRRADAVVAGPLLMVAAQIGLFLIALQVFARAAFDCGIRGRRLFVLLTLWVPPISGIIGVVWKDVWMSCLLLLGCGFALSIRHGQDVRTRYLYFLASICALLGALLFRHNAAFAALPVVVYSAWTLLGTGGALRRGSLALGAGVIATTVLLGATTWVNRALTTQREYPVQSLLLFDVAGISVLTDRSVFDAVAHRIPQLVRGQDAVSIAALRASYYPSTWTPLVFVADSPLAVATSAAEVKELESLWRKAIIDAPRAYVAHRESVFRQVVGAHAGPLFAPVYFGVPTNSPDYAVVSKAFEIQPGEVATVQRLLRDGFAFSATLIIYRPWFWLGLNVLLIGIATVVSARRTALVAVGLSGLLYELPLFFIAPSADYRYSHWLVLSTWALLATLVAEALPKLKRNRASPQAVQNTQSLDAV
jgi:hypothetical protein